MAREVIILFDSNVRTNPKVFGARIALAEELIGRGANVRTADLPEVDGVNGPDDAVALGDDVVLAILDSARPWIQVALVQAEELVHGIETNSNISSQEIRRCLESVALVEDEIEQKLLLARMGKALRGRIKKADLEAKIGSLLEQHATGKSKIEEHARFAELRNLPINPRKLLTDLVSYFSERVYLPEGAAVMLALFTMNTHVFDVFDTTPYVDIESAIAGCGKTTLLSVLHHVVARPVETTALTEASMFRLITTTKPTLLIDEAEFLKGRSERAELLRATANVGYKCEATIYRCEGDDHELREYAVYGPKVFALLGGLQGPLLDRSIIITMEKRPRGRTWKSCRKRILKRDTKHLRNQLEAYGLQARESLSKLYDSEPDETYWPELIDREAEIFGPLLLHARLIGPDIEAQALQAAQLLSRRKLEAQGQEFHRVLVVELAGVLKEYAGDRFGPAEIVSELENCEQWAAKLSECKDARSRCAAIGRYLSRFRFSSRKHYRTGSTYQTQEVLQKLVALTSSASATSAPEPTITVSVTPSVTAKGIVPQALTAVSDRGDGSDSENRWAAGNTMTSNSKFNPHDLIVSRNYPSLVPLEILDTRDGDLLVRHGSSDRTFWVRAQDSKHWN